MSGFFLLKFPFNMHDFLSVALVVAFSMVCTNTFAGLYSPGDIMSSFGETSTIIWSRETIGVWEIQVRGAKGVYWTNIKCMNETKIEEILNQYQFKHIYCTDRGCWALDLAQNLPSQIIPGQSSLLTFWCLYLWIVGGFFCNPCK